DFLLRLNCVRLWLTVTENDSYHANMDTASKVEEFVTAQQPVYKQVVRELTAGRKQSHWMWFIFPQIAGLGFSSMSQKFGIDSLEQARSYLAHPVLGPRLRECTRLMLAVSHGDVSAVLGYPDDPKRRLHRRARRPASGACIRAAAALTPDGPDSCAPVQANQFQTSATSS